MSSFTINAFEPVVLQHKHIFHYISSRTLHYLLTRDYLYFPRLVSHTAFGAIGHGAGSLRRALAFLYTVLFR